MFAFCRHYYSIAKQYKLNTVKPVLSIHIKQDMFFAFKTDSCLLLHKSSAEELSELLSFRNK